MAQVRVWDGGGGNSAWTNGLNWTDDNAPDSAGEDAVIDGNALQSAFVTNIIANNIAITNGALTVNAGDTLSVGRVNASGTSAHLLTGALDNAGTIYTGGGNMNAAHGNTLNVTVQGGAGGTFNSSSGLMYVQSLGGFRRSSASFFLPAGNTNDGTVYVRNITAEGSGFVRLSLTGPGSQVFVNNGAIVIEGRGSTDMADQPWAVMGPGTTASTLTIAGNGTLTLASVLSSHPRSFAVVAGVTSNTTLVHASTHTLRGNGFLGRAGNNGTRGNNVTVHSFTDLINEGLVVAERSSAWTTLHVAAGGGRVLNAAAGRMVAAGNAGTVLRIGSDTSAGSFTNHGLLEARGGSSVWFATNLTTTLRGETRGGGTFAGSPTVSLSTTVLRPGDSENGDGTGDSTVGTLSVNGNLAFASGAAFAVQLGAAGVAGIDYDTVVVSGNVTLDGTVDVEGMMGFGAGGVYRVLTCAPGGLTDNGLRVGSLGSGVPTPQVVVSVAKGTVDLVFPPRTTLITVR